MFDYEFESKNHSRENWRIKLEVINSEITKSRASEWSDYFNSPADSEQNILISKTDGIIFANNNSTSFFHSNNRHCIKKCGGVSSNVVMHYKPWYIQWGFCFGWEKPFAGDVWPNFEVLCNNWFIDTLT